MMNFNAQMPIKPVMPVFSHGPQARAVEEASQKKPSMMLDGALKPKGPKVDTFELRNPAMDSMNKTLPFQSGLRFGASAPEGATGSSKPAGLVTALLLSFSQAQPFASIFLNSLQGSPSVDAMALAAEGAKTKKGLDVLG